MDKPTIDLPTPISSHYRVEVLTEEEVLASKEVTTGVQIVEGLEQDSDLPSPYSVDSVVPVNGPVSRASKSARRKRRPPRDLSS
jgi:hypothetical protein